MTTPFKPIDRTIKALITAKLSGATGKVGADLSYTASQDFYVWIGLIPGASSSDRTSGYWTADIDVFGTDYLETMQRALDLEAILLNARGFRHDGQQIDVVFQSSAPGEIPWDDDKVYRISATYTFSARRAG